MPDSAEDLWIPEKVNFWLWLVLRSAWPAYVASLLLLTGDLGSTSPTQNALVCSGAAAVVWTPRGIYVVRSPVLTDHQPKKTLVV